MRDLRIVPLIMAALALSASCERGGENIYRKNAVLMDTSVTITVVSDSPEKAEAAIDYAFSEISRLEKLISFWDGGSEISAVNKLAGKSGAKASAETMAVARESLFISEKTDGGFDPTVGPVIRLYDFKAKKLPDEKALMEKLPLVDYRAVRIDEKNSTISLSREGMAFDTGGIAKGYAADLAVKAITEKGVKAGLVSVAGDIRAFGQKPGGGPWMVGIRNPRAKGADDDIMASFALVNSAVSTSGDYERSFVIDGKRHHHILNPKTGRPGEGLISVTVVGPKGVYSDGFATGIFIAGPEKGIELAGELGLELIMVDEKCGIIMTDGLKDKVTIKNRPAQSECLR